jgi:uncharacterized cupin superfamily protein
MGADDGGMERIDIDDVDPAFFGDEDVDRRALTDELNASDLAINYYRLEPGQSFSGGMHTHMDQEEVFYVVDGVATFQTPEGEYEVGPDEAIRFAPGDYQSGRNDTDDDVVALALGAPRESTDIRVPMECRDCGDTDTMQFQLSGADGSLKCPECGTTVDL